MDWWSIVAQEPLKKKNNNKSTIHQSHVDVYANERPVVKVIILSHRCFDYSVHVVIKASVAQPFAYTYST